MPTTATASELSPANASTEQSYNGDISIKWTPVDNATNPITGTPTISLNGTALAVTVATLTGGVKVCTAHGAARAREVNSVSSTATTLDANPNTQAWTYTAHKPFGSTWSETDFNIPGFGFIEGAVDYAVPALTPSEGLVDFAVQATGLLSEINDLVEYAVMEAATGVLQSIPALTDYYAVDMEFAKLTPIGANIGEPGASTLGLGANINAFDHTPLVGLGANVSATDHVALAGIGADIATEFHGKLCPIGANVGEPGSSTFGLGADIAALCAEFHVELFIASTALQEVEDEP